MQILLSKINHPKVIPDPPPPTGEFLFKQTGDLIHLRVPYLGVFLVPTTMVIWGGGDWNMGSTEKTETIRMTVVGVDYCFGYR